MTLEKLHNKGNPKRNINEFYWKGEINKNS